MNQINKLSSENSPKFYLHNGVGDYTISKGRKHPKFQWRNFYTSYQYFAMSTLSAAFIPTRDS